MSKMSRSENQARFRSYISKLARTFVGPVAEPIVIALSERRETTEEWLIKRTGLKLSVIRKVLYELFDVGIVRYRREKEPDTGWFTYYWSLDYENLANVVLRRKKLVLEKLKARLEYEKQNMFFACPNHPEKRYTFDEAYDHSFKCPECDSVLENQDNSMIIRFIEDLMKKIESESQPTTISIDDP